MFRGLLTKKVKFLTKAGFNVNGKGERYGQSNSLVMETQTCCFLSNLIPCIAAFLVGSVTQNLSHMDGF